jgi:membrane associated rhomboid family serine protease
MDRFFPTREPDDPWFRVGAVDVTTTILICGLCVVSFFVWAISAEFLSKLQFDPEAVKQGQIWRLVTWPIANVPGLWPVLGIIFFYLLGRELERMLGRNRFLWFLLFVTVIPAAIATLLDLQIIADIGGISLLLDGVFLVFVLRYPTVRSFFNIPLWVFGAVFLGIEVLQLFGLRSNGTLPTLWFLLLVLGVAALTGRAMGILEELDWMPKVPLPHSLSGEPAAPRRSRTPKGRPRSRRGPAEVIPMRPGQPTPDDLLRQAEIDVLLDKISEHGLDSLTADERRRLDEHSRRLRGEG